jgi:hypothetical protein
MQRGKFLEIASVAQHCQRRELAKWGKAVQDADVKID